MKLTKGKDSRPTTTSLPVSASTSPPAHSTTLSTLGAPGNLEVDQFLRPPPSARKMTRKDENESKNPPSSFFFGRTFSFGMKGKKGFRAECSSHKTEGEGGKGAPKLSVVTPKAKPALRALDAQGPISPLPGPSPVLPTRCSASSCTRVSLPDSQRNTFGSPSYRASPNDDSLTTRPEACVRETSPRQLAKRRPVSIIQENVEAAQGLTMVTGDSVKPYGVQRTYPHVETPSSPPSLRIPAPDSPNMTITRSGWSSSLERNGSSSTAGSSALGASSAADSDILETPLGTREDCLEGKAGELTGFIDGVSDLEARSNTSLDALQAADVANALNLFDFLPLEKKLLPIPASPTPSDNARPAFKSPSPVGSAADSASTVQSASSAHTPRPRAPSHSLSAWSQASTSKRTANIDRSLTGSPCESSRGPRRSSPLLRPRSASGSGTSTFTNSVYSAGDVVVATEGSTSQVQVVDIAALSSLPLSPVKIAPTHDGPSLAPAEEDVLLRSLAASTTQCDSGRAREDHRPANLKLRTPPLPPHLARLTSNKGPTSTSPAPVYVSAPLSSNANPPKRPRPLPRSSSLGQLWRRMSTGGSSRPAKGPTRAQTEGLSKTPQPKKHTARFDGVPGVSIPELPSPIPPIAIRQLIRKASLGRARAPKSPKGPASRVEETVPPVPLVPPSAEEAIFPSKGEDRIFQPVGIRLSPKTSTILELPLAATPLVRTPLHATPLETQIEDYFQVKEHNRSNPIVTYGSPDSTVRDPRSPIVDKETKEKRRKYRQTLVDIKDDVVFHQVLADLARLQSHTPTPHDEMTSHEPSASYQEPEDNVLEMKPTKRVSRSPPGLISERKAREESIRAWFVTREIVQGERRHGRLLARGVATVRRAAEAMEKNVAGADYSPIKPTRSKSSKGIRRRGVSFDNDPVASNHLDNGVAQNSPSPISILLEHLPRLLAVSLTLSSRFEHDPSPIGVAQAFGAMEAELSNEIGLWAGEVGNLVAMGLGNFVDRESPSPSRGTSESEMSPKEMDPDDRLGLSDIILMPITRALRYKLLFKELLEKMPNNTVARTEVESALRASDRLAAECDRRQVQNLDALRRGRWAKINDETNGKVKKSRPRSLGTSVSSNAIAARVW